MESQDNTAHLNENIKELVGLLKQSAIASNRKTEVVSTSSFVSDGELNKILGHRRKYLLKPRPQAVKNIMNYINQKP